MQESAFSLRRRAEDFLKQGKYSEAADAFRREAEARRRLGDPNGAKVEERKADRYTSSVSLFAHVPGEKAGRAGALAKWEPPYGCYIGAFIDRDERLGRPFFANDQTHQSVQAFGDRTGKKHASAFCYLAYGRPFPRQWAEWLADQGAAPHIAWEPNSGLGPVRDDNYLREFARDAARARCPIFLRFASEMNGDWTSYHGDPLKYKVAWATVQRVMAQVAPNVAMVWCVNHIPETEIERYYPGDGYVDWVGVNFYSVPFYDNDPSHPGFHDNPADMLSYVYRLYAARKPIMVCEFGASHRARVDNMDRSEWAGGKIAELYASLPRLYPRVKMVDVFDNDNIKYAEPGRQLSDYSVTNSSVVQAAYARAIAPNYFLSDVLGGTGGTYRRPTAVVPLNNKSVTTVRRGILPVSSWARCWSEQFTVAYGVDGREMASVIGPGPREAGLFLTPGTRRVFAVVRDEGARVVARAEATIKVI